MSKPWIIAVSVCGLMALVLLTKPSRRGDSAGASAPKAVDALASTPRGQRSGWLAIEGGGPAGAAARSGRQPKAGRGSAELGAGRESTPNLDLPGSGARVGTGGGSGIGGSGSGVGYADSEPIRAGGSVAGDTGLLAGAGLTSGAGHGQPNMSGTGSVELVKKTDNPANGAPEDPNGPTVSLPFDNTTEPKKGEVPLVNENVTCGGSGEGCVFGTDARFAIPDAANLTGEAGSISFCLQPQWDGTDQSNASLVNLHGNTWENRFTVFKNGNGLRFLLWPNNGVETGVGAKIDGWQAGTWHPVTATYGPDPNTGTNMVSLYVDGALIGRNPYDGQLNLPQVPLYIGSDYPAGSPAAQSAFKDFQAYNRVLGAGEVADFAAGCPQ